MTRDRLMCLVVVGVFGVVLGGCVTNAATGKRQINYLSQAEEIRIGEEAMREALPAYGGELREPRVSAYVREVGMRVAREVEPEYADLPWEFVVLDSDIVNAFALPGGKVFISRGLLAEMESEAELAGVLAHEVAHVTAEHHDLGMQRQIGLAVLAAAGGVAASQVDDDRVALATGVLVTGAGLFALRYDRGQEYESDELGLRYMTRAGYNPEGLVGVMRTLDELSGGAGGVEWTSTHPHAANRVERLRGIIADRYAQEAASPAMIVGRAEYEENVLRRLR